MPYLLCPLSNDQNHVLYEWKLNEQNWDLYTCRPVGMLLTEERFIKNLEKEIAQGTLQVYVIVAEQDISQPLGRITLFDYNPRNRSAELGYYIPSELRSQGIGQNMMRLFLERVFEQDNDLNKVYATTSSNNDPSIRLLEGNGFTLDGRLREHYWIRGRRYDQLHYSMLRSDWELLMLRK